MSDPFIGSLLALFSVLSYVNATRMVPMNMDDPPDSLHPLHQGNPSGMVSFSLQISIG
jgi:hypothetical protein